MSKGGLGSSQRDVISPESNRRRYNGNGNSSANGGSGRDDSRSTPPNKTANASPVTSPRSEMSNTSLAPVGLSGPTSFQFSPSPLPLPSPNVAGNKVHGEKQRQRYLSFLSSHQNLSEQNATAATVSGSPIRTIGGNGSSGEKRLFAMELEPIWNAIDQDDDRSRMEMEETSTTERRNHLHDPNTVMEAYVSPLLNASLPFDRPHGQYNGGTFSPLSGTGSSSYGPASPNHLAGVSDTSLSLEEKLRRERQRVHSNGVTQFAWGKYQMSASADECILVLPSLGMGKPSPTPTKRSIPEPERIPSPVTTEYDEQGIRIIVPLRGNIYIQDGVGPIASSPLRLLYDKSMLEDVDNCTNESSKEARKRQNRRSTGSAVGRDTGAIDAQLSPDGSMVAFVVSGEIYVMSCGDTSSDGIEIELDDSGPSSMETAGYANDENGDSLLSDTRKPTRLTYGAMNDDDASDFDDDMSASSDESGSNENRKKNYGRSVTHGLADFVAQEEMDRYRGFWWDETSNGIIFVRVDESCVPPYRITHQGTDGTARDEANYEEHRYPFAGESNPVVTLGYIEIDRDVIVGPDSQLDCEVVAKQSWSKVKWFDAPDDTSEYLARVNWLPDGSACAQWQDRRQSTLVLVKIDVHSGESIILHREQSDVWINLHHMFKVLPRPVNPNECLEDESDVDQPELSDGSFSYIFVSERTGFSHIYLYTYIPGDVSATLLRVVSSGDWIVESIVGVDMQNDLVYFTGTHDSPLEKHLYVLPLTNASQWTDLTTDENEEVNGVRKSLRQVMNSLSGGSSTKSLNKSSRRLKSFSSYTYSQPVSSAEPPNPVRLTSEAGMHSVTMDASCRIFVDTCSDLARPTTTKIYSIPANGPSIQDEGSGATDVKLRSVLYDATQDFSPALYPSPPELLSFPTSDGTETLHAALYRPNPKVHGPGPYPLICAVYGGPHVQRVTRSWCQCSDMRVQRLCSMGFAVVKCDNRGSSRRGLQFEGAIKNHLGRFEVLDQVTAVRHLVMKRIADPLRVGIYGWSYGGYLAAMCLCRAPDVFSVGIAGAPVTSWDGYDTHYTERYMGLPAENQSGYNEAAVFEHVPNMRGKLLIIHGLIDENVHFRHTARLINRLVAAGKDYDLLLFPDERHSPRRLRDRIYMEKRMCDYFLKNLLNACPTILGNL